MQKLFSLLYNLVVLMLGHLFLQRMTLFAFGSFDSAFERKCEYEDANLIWRNIPAYSPNDVKAKSWYKENYTRIATWMEKTGFVENPSYIGRLMQIGETGIKLRRANRSDSGSYWLSLTLASTYKTLDAKIHLEIIVAPSSQCKPTITEKGQILKAQVPSVGCGIPPLSPIWINTSKTMIQEAQHIRLLDLGSDFATGEYVVCAEGYSAICYEGNMSDLCTGLTKSHHGQRDDGWTPNPVSIILPVVLIALIAVVVLVVIFWKRKMICGNRQSDQMCLPPEDKPTDIAEGCQHNEQIPLIEKGEASMEGLGEVENYLRSLYKYMKRVSVSPTGKENFVDVSEVYIELDLQQVETRDLKYTETDLSWTTSKKVSVSNDDTRIGKEHKQHVSPIIIMGCSGSGKSTWSKYLVHCWSERSKNEDANVQDINLLNLAEYKILLYLPLKYSDRGRSFQELLKLYLFKEHSEYFNTVTKYIRDKRHAQSVLILIDGFNKIGENVKLMSELLDDNLLDSSTVILTCRPSCLKWIFSAYIDISIPQVFKVCQLLPEKSKVYANKVLRSLNKHNKDYSTFLTFSKNLHAQTLLYLPYHCLLLLFIWMENEKPNIEITDILLCIVEHILDNEETDTRCKAKILQLLQRNTSKIYINIKKIDDQYVHMKDLLYLLSMITEEIFLSKSKIFPENSASDTLSLEILHDIGLITEYVPLKSVESLSTVTFTNMLIYQLFVSMAIAFKKGHVFEYIISDLEVALTHSMTINMLLQFSPTLGDICFVNLNKLETNKIDKLCLCEGTNGKFRCSITKDYKKINYQVTWLQLLMYKGGDLDDEKLLFLTNALRSINSLTSLVLENNENNDDLVFWLPCSQTLKKLEISINNCTVLLCPEWNDMISMQLEEVVIKSVIISSRDSQVLLRALRSCKCTKIEMPSTDVSIRDI